MLHSPPPVDMRWTAALLLAGLTVFLGCANPVRPSGGPRDQTPPRIASSTPAAEATEVSGQTVEIVFTEYVEQGSLREALSVTPTPAGRVEVEWSGRRAEITFPEPLRDSTTYVLTIDKALSDVRGVSLEQPLTLAFSTGAQIDRGRLSGRVVGSTQGQGREGFDVYAYAASAAEDTTLPDAPLYRTQTGPDGTFQFDYLRSDQPYYVVALRDQNRNRQPDPTESFAAPPRPTLPAGLPDSAGIRSARMAAAGADSLRTDSLRTDSLSIEKPWVIGRKDVAPPRLTRALPLSQGRLALRFSEPIRLQARQPERFALTDTTTGQSIAIRNVYRHPDQEQRITLRTAPMQPTGHRVRLRGDSTLADALTSAPPVVTDTSGNAPAVPARAAFTAPEHADTLGLRFLGFEKSGPPFPISEEGDALVLVPGQAPAVQFNQPPAGDSAGLRPSALLTARDTSTGQPLPFQLETDDGTTYRLQFTPPLDSTQVARIRVDARRLRPPADTAYTRLVRRLPGHAQGAVSGAVQIAADSAALEVMPAETSDASAAPAAATLLVELYPAEGAPGSPPLRTTRVDSSGRFIFRGLPDASYRFRAFLDRNANRQWDAGRLAPYRPAEPLAWSRQPTRARPRWETATQDTLRIANVQR